MATSSSAQSIESLDQFPANSAGEAQRWHQEIVAAEDDRRRFNNQGRKVVARYQDSRRDHHMAKSHLNKFWSNTSLIESIMFGNVPTVDVKRRFSDSQDDVARVASEMLERMLNADIEDDDDSFTEAVEMCISDRLLPGLACARVRYEVEIEERECAPVCDPAGNVVAEGYVEKVKTHEDAPIDYVYWEDFLYSPARVWNEVRWVAFRVQMTKDEATKRFGEEGAKKIQYKATAKKDQYELWIDADPWQRGEVLEIWDKDAREVIWWTKGADTLLDKKPDPLGLRGFWPCPKPMMANLTTSRCMPRADYMMAQDQYSELNQVTTRINLLKDALKAVGVYDSSATSIQRMLREGVTNELIPEENWAIFQEKGGIDRMINWMPLQDIAAALQGLRDYRRELIELLDDITGMPDIIRGQSTTTVRSATEQGIKGFFGSARLQKLQGTVARFAADLQRLKAEVIVRHFDPQNIVARSNVMQTNDAKFAQNALQLLKSKFTEYRIKIDSEAMSLTDYGRLQSESTQFATAVSQFLTAASPLMQEDPRTTPYLMRMMQEIMSGFRGADRLESILDDAIEASQQPQEQQQQPDPQLQKEQVKLRQQQEKSRAKQQEILAKSQADIAKIQAETQAKLAELQTEAQVDASREATQARYNIREEQAKSDIRLDEKLTVLAAQDRVKAKDAARRK